MVVIGIDPHKGSHTAVAINEDETKLDEVRVRADRRQLETLRRWASAFPERSWAIESANGLGALLSQQLVGAGEEVFDVPPTLSSRVRVLASGKSQKNDPNDAFSVAIAALRSSRLRPVVTEDHIAVLRLLSNRHSTPRRCAGSTPYWPASSLVEPVDGCRPTRPWPCCRDAGP